MSSNGMYLGIDIGGSKTLLAVFDKNGEIRDTCRLPTNEDYTAFLQELETVLKEKLSQHNFIACCCAVPGKLDRKQGIAVAFGNLAWKNVGIKKELERMLGHIPILLENDAKLAGLSEAKLLQQKYRKVLYLTVSTGIGDGIIIDGKIDPDFLDSEPGQMIIEHEGRIQKWEDFASGRALVDKYGKKASEIDDPKIWAEFSRGLALGMNELIATLQPEVIVLGGGVGAHYDKFRVYLESELAKLANELVITPPILKAKRPEEAVAYGCYDYIKSHGF